MIQQFTVSEARNAITCPRIFYFDEERYRRTRPVTKRLTRLWAPANETVSGCGTLFHQTIERFNDRAGKKQDIRQALEHAHALPTADARTNYIADELIRFINVKCLDRKAFGKKLPPQIEAFKVAVRQYTSELANIFSYALVHGRSPEELVHEFFGDTRKRVDVTFYVAKKNAPVRLRGILDYIYFDHRQAVHRILDFKLLSGDATSKDLLQTSLYALMHQQQHGTHPDIAVMYLYPTRRMVERNWAGVDADRHKVYNLLASMAEWAQYDETKRRGLLPPGEPSLCAQCPWSKRGQCTRRLGPATDGSRSELWTLAQPGVPEPKLVAHAPPESPAPEVYDEDDETAVDEVEEVQGPVVQSVAAEEEQVTATPFILATELELGQTHATSAAVTMPIASLTTHVSILGAAGSGKSWVAKVVAEEAIRSGVPVLAIDPQGDLVQFIHAAKLPPDATAADRSALNAFRQQAEVRLWTPGTSHAQRLCLSPLRLPKPSDLQGIENDQRRQEEWEAMLGVAAGNIVQLAQAGGDEEVQQTFVLEILRKLIDKQVSPDAIGLNDIVAAMAAPENIGLDDAAQMIKKTVRERLMQRINARLRGPTANLFSGGLPLDLDRFVAPLDAGKTPLNVVYLNALADDSQKQYFVAAVAAEVYRWMITSPSTGKVKLLLYLDEARDFLPAGGAKPPAKEPLLRLFSQGRKFGVSCLICTQSPRSVDYNVFSNASTKLIGRLESSQDIERVGEWFKDAGGKPEWLSTRLGAKSGDFIGRWPQMASDLEGQSFKSRQLYSLHEGAWSPDRVEEAWKESPLAARLANA